jgi:hypothetical protein
MSISSTAQSAISWVARGTRAAQGRPGHRCQRIRLGEERRERLLQGRRHLRLGHETCRARIGEKARVRRLVIVDGVGQRNQDRGRPVTASSATVRAPARQITRSAQA